MIRTQTSKRITAAIAISNHHVTDFETFVTDFGTFVTNFLPSEILYPHRASLAPHQRVSRTHQFARREEQCRTLQSLPTYNPSRDMEERAYTSKVEQRRQAKRALNALLYERKRQEVMDQHAAKRAAAMATPLFVLPQQLAPQQLSPQQLPLQQPWVHPSPWAFAPPPAMAILPMQPMQMMQNMVLPPFGWLQLVSSPQQLPPQQLPPLQPWVSYSPWAFAPLPAETSTGPSDASPPDASAIVDSPVPATWVLSQPAPPPPPPDKPPPDEPPPDEPPPDEPPSDEDETASQSPATTMGQPSPPPPPSRTPVAAVADASRASAATPPGAPPTAPPNSPLVDEEPDAEPDVESDVEPDSAPLTLTGLFEFVSDIMDCIMGHVYYKPGWRHQAAHPSQVCKAWARWHETIGREAGQSCRCSRGISFEAARRVGKVEPPNWRSWAPEIKSLRDEARRLIAKFDANRGRVAQDKLDRALDKLKDSFIAPPGLVDSGILDRAVNHVKGLKADVQLERLEGQPGMLWPLEQLKQLRTWGRATGYWRPSRWHFGMAVGWRCHLQSAWLTFYGKSWTAEARALEMRQCVLLARSFLETRIPPSMSS